MSATTKTVSLFIPCLVDQVCPEIGLAMANVLRRVGVTVTYDPAQTCCGQPAFNAGFRREALQVAGHFLEVFEGAEAIVAPSGSCVAMVRHHYGRLFDGDPRQAQARALGARVFEFSEFLVHQLGITEVGAVYSGRVTFHHSCHSVHELRVFSEPLTLLRQVQNLELREAPADPVCCGFGGVFSIKFAEIASTMTRSRLEAYSALGVDTVVSNDPGCLLQLRRCAASQGMPLKFMHLAEVLSGFPVRSADAKSHD